MTGSPILVSGIHRSGTTWVGTVLAQSADVGYIHEPFNGICRPGQCAATFPYPYLHITPKNEQCFYVAIQHMLTFRYNLRTELSTVTNPLGLARLSRDCGVFWGHRLTERKALLKDPMAILSAPWLAQRFNTQVLILVRHPAAFVSSCLQLGWGFHFSNFLRQPILMETHFSPFKAEIEKYSHLFSTGIEGLALLWKLIYSVVATYQHRHRNWLILRYEDICHSPQSSFINIYNHFGLAFTPKVNKFIQNTTHYKEITNIREEIHSVRRDTKRQPDIWKKRLSKTDAETIRLLVEPVSSFFYKDCDWAS